MGKPRFLVLAFAALLVGPVTAQEYWPAPNNRAEWVQNTSRLMKRLRTPSGRALQIEPRVYSFVIDFSVRPDGKVTEVRMLEGSGVARLDEIILEQVAKMPLAPFPADMGREERRFNQPVSLVVAAPKENTE